RSAFCKVIQATANPTAVSAAATSAGATSTRSSALSAATMPTTRRNMTADATATPAASSRGEPSRAAARRALVMVTAVEDATPPAGGGQQHPGAGTKLFPRRIAEEGDAGENKGNEPALPWIDAAKRSQWRVGQDRQADERHGQQPHRRSQFRPRD